MDDVAMLMVFPYRYTFTFEEQSRSSMSDPNSLIITCFGGVAGSSPATFAKLAKHEISVKAKIVKRFIVIYFNGLVTQIYSYRHLLSKLNV